MVQKWGHHLLALLLARGTLVRNQGDPDFLEATQLTMILQLHSLLLRDILCLTVAMQIRPEPVVRNSTHARLDEHGPNPRPTQSTLARLFNAQLISSSYRE